MEGQGVTLLVTVRAGVTETEGVGVPPPAAPAAALQDGLPEAVPAAWEGEAAPVPVAEPLGPVLLGLPAGEAETESVPLPEPLPVTVSVPVVHTLELVEGDAVPVPLPLAL